MAKEKEASIDLQELSKKINKYAKNQKNNYNNYDKSNIVYIGEVLQRFEEFDLTLFDTIMLLENFMVNKSYNFDIMSDNTNQLSNYLCLLKESMKDLNDDEKYYIAYIILCYYTYWKKRIYDYKQDVVYESEKYFYYFIDIVFKSLLKREFIDDEFIKCISAFMRIKDRNSSYLNSSYLINDDVRHLIIEAISNKKINIDIADEEKIKKIIILKKYLGLKKKEIKDKDFFENLRKLSKLGKYFSLEELPFEIFKNEKDVPLLNVFLFKFNNNLTGGRYQGLSDKRKIEFEKITQLLTNYIEEKYSFEEYIEFLNKFVSILKIYELDLETKNLIINKDLKFKDYDSLFNSFFNVLYDIVENEKNESMYGYTLGDKNSSHYLILNAVINIVDKIKIDRKKHINNNFSKYLSSLDDDFVKKVLKRNSIKKVYLAILSIFGYAIFDDLSFENKDMLLKHLLKCDIVHTYDDNSKLFLKDKNIVKSASILDVINLYINNGSMIMILYKYLKEKSFHSNVNQFVLSTLYFNIIIEAIVEYDLAFDKKIVESYIDGLTLEEFLINSYSDLDSLMKKFPNEMDLIISNNIEKIEGFYFQKGLYINFLVLILKFPISRNKLNIKDTDYFHLLKDNLSFNSKDINTTEYMLSNQELFTLNDYFKNNIDFQSEILDCSLLNLKNNFIKFDNSDIFKIVKNIENLSKNKEIYMNKFLDILIQNNDLNSNEWIRTDEKIKYVDEIINNQCYIKPCLFDSEIFKIISYLYEINMISINKYLEFTEKLILKGKNTYESNL